MKKIIAAIIFALMLTVTVLSVSSCKLNGILKPGGSSGSGEQTPGDGEGGDSEDGEGDPENPGGSEDGEGDPENPGGSEDGDGEGGDPAVKTYRVTFSYGFGAEDSVLYYNEGALMDSPAVPTREGYNFDGWYTNDVKWDFENDTVNSDLSFTIGWSVKYFDISYVLGYEGVQNLNPLTYDVVTGDIILTEPSLDRYAFEGWYLDADFTLAVNVLDINSFIGDGIELYAKWKSMAEFFEYEIVDGAAVITGYNGSFDRLFVPETLGGYTVEVIGEGAFLGCESLEYIEIPTCVKKIEAEAFMGCSALASFVANGLEYIGDRAFTLCIKIIVIIICDSVTEIGEGAFSGCSGATSITIGSGVTEIGDGAFEDCSSASSILLGENVKEIGDSAFKGCSSVTEIALPDGLESIGADAFALCIKIVMIIIPDSVTAVGEGAFDGCDIIVVLVYWVVLPEGWLEGWLGESTNEDRFFDFESWEFADESKTTVNLFGEWYTESLPTCGEDGEERRDYLNVQGQYQSRPIPATGDHSYEVTDSKEPDCENDGYAVMTCSVCTHSYTSKNGEATGHSYQVISVTPPTCEEDGYTYYECSVEGCEGSKKDDVTSATGHSYEVISVTPPTCDEGGYTYYECSADGCDASKNGDLLDPLGHDHALVSVIAPTCEEDGYSYYECKRAGCNNSKKADYTGAIGHHYLPVNVVDPLCESSGYTYYECDRFGCDAYKTDDILPALTHDFESAVTPPTCEEDGYTTHTCKRVGCGYSYTDEKTGALDHDYGSVVTSPDCENGGYTTYTCKRAGCGHSYVGDETDALGHDYDAAVTDPTCTEGGYTTYTCKRVGCESVVVGDRLDALGHNYIDGACSVCGETVSLGLEYMDMGDCYYVTGRGTCTDTEIVIPSVYNGLPVVCISYGAFRYEEDIVSVTFPDSIVRISEEAFHGCTSLKEIVIPEGVKYIGEYAFLSCTGVTKIYYNAIEANDLKQIESQPFYAAGGDDGIEVIIGKNVKRIPSYMFYSNYSSTAIYESRITKVSFEEESVLESIGAGAFTFCRSLTEITLPDTVTSVGDGAFYGCVRLERADLGNSFTEVPRNLFYECSALVEVYIPASVVTIGASNYSFYECTSLTAINVDEDNEYYASVDGVLYDKALTTLILYPAGKAETELVIPDTVTTVSARAVNGASNLVKLTISAEVKTIGEYAFANLVNLVEIRYNAVSANNLGTASRIFNGAGSEGGGTTLIVGKDVTYIPAYFMYSQNSSYINNNIIAVEYEEGCTVEKIGDYAFYANKLETVIIPASVKEIGYCAYGAPSVLKTIYYNAVEASVSSMNYPAFRGNYRLAVELYVDEAVKVIPDYMFYNGSDGWLSIVSVNFVGETTCETIGYGAFYNTALKSIKIPASVKEIKGSAFYGCSDLTSVEFEEDCVISKIEDYVFFGTALKSIEIPASVKSIGGYVFFGLSSLSEVKLNEGLTTIGSAAFANCISLKEIVVPTTVIQIYSSAFGGCSSLERITLPFIGATRNAIAEEAVLGYIFGYTAVNNYRNKDIYHGSDGTYYTSSNTMTQTSPSDSFVNLIIGGSSGSKIWQYTCYDYYYSKKYYMQSYFYNIPASLTSVTVTDATSISAAAFNGCRNLTEISLNDGITSIGASAFQNCVSLESFRIPAGISSLQPNLFSSCTGLKSLTVSENSEYYSSVNGDVYSKDGKTLVLCISGRFNENVTVADGTESIDQRAFDMCSAIKNLVIPDSVTTMARGTLSGCTSLESLTLPFVGHSRDSVNYEAVFGYIFGSTSISLYYTTGYVYDAVSGEVLGSNDSKYAYTTSSSYVFANYMWGDAAAVITQDGYIWQYSCHTIATGGMYDRKYMLNCMYYAIPTTLTSVTVTDDSTIETAAFNGCYFITELTLGNTVSIGDFAFQGCTGLETVNYLGNEESFAAITLGEGNALFTAATVNYIESEE